MEQKKTCIEIVSQLINGESLKWTDSKKEEKITLESSRQRSLFRYFYDSGVRSKAAVDQDFLNGLSKTFHNVDEQGLSSASKNGNKQGNPCSWKLVEIESENFGGLNSWNKETFRHSLDGESLLLEGENGSGKSSLINAVLWGMLGICPKGEVETPAETPQTVFDNEPKSISQWPPIVSYPETPKELETGVANTYVTLTLQNNLDEQLKITRNLQNGQISSQPTQIPIPQVFLETGLLMPLRISKIKIKDKESPLIDVIKQIIGLDDLQVLGKYIGEFSRGNGVYLDYSAKQGLESKKTSFEAEKKYCVQALAPIEMDLPNFTPQDTENQDGEIVVFGKELRKQQEALEKNSNVFFSLELKLSENRVQKELTLLIGNIQEKIKNGLNSLPFWSKMVELKNCLTPEYEGQIVEAMHDARQEWRKAKVTQENIAKDNRYQLKVTAAKWHLQHSDAKAISICPLCEQTLSANPQLKEELEKLKNSAIEASLSYKDDLNRISSNLNAKIIAAFKYFLDSSSFQLCDLIVADIHREWINQPEYKKLRGFLDIIEAALNSYLQETNISNPTKLVESAFLPLDEQEKFLETLLQNIEQIITLIKEFGSKQTTWEKWWKQLAENDNMQKNSDDATTHGKSLVEYLNDASQALEQLAPITVALEHLKAAWELSAEIVKIEAEQALREKIIQELAPLKNLSKFIDAVVTVTLETLSGRIGEILEGMQLAESLQYSNATYDRKAGINIWGGFSSKVQIDATLVANTSWLRSLLWAFIFALREEAVKQHGYDPFPVMIFDDPQVTLDAEHQQKWADYIASLQKQEVPLQIMLLTYCERFFDKLQLEGLKGRKGRLAGVKETGSIVVIFEGDKIDRLWKTVQNEKTAESAKRYINELRIHTETMLKIICKDIAPNSSTYVIGNFRTEITQYHNKGITPWNNNVFNRLSAALNDTCIKYMENAHHTTGSQQGVPEAKRVEEFWRKSLSPALDGAYRLLREHKSLHSGLSTLHAPEPKIKLPECFQDIISRQEFKFLGQAAAITDGRSSDGYIEFEECDSQDVFNLKDHLPYRLNANTLQPVAEVGDILLTLKHNANLLPDKSLGVIIYEDKCFVRRFSLADNHSDIAILTAQSNDPNETLAPMVVQSNTITFKKIVGILFDYEARKTYSKNDPSLGEISEIKAENDLTKVLSNVHGYAKVKGKSAVPLVLDKQFLILGEKLSDESIYQQWDGRPVVAIDSNEEHYFKRLRIQKENVILESLTNDGYFEPIQLSLSEEIQDIPMLKEVWPVLGVIFEK